MTRHLQEAKRYGVSGSVLYLDIDRFKQVNDSYGHHVGDEALKKLALVLKHRFRATDPVGRLGGDEFAVLLPRVDEKRAEEIASDLASSLAADPLTVGDEILTLSASTGVACYDRESVSVSELIMQADRSMYVAKRQQG